MAKMVSIFSCTYLPSEYFPCWSVCANLWPNFQRSFLKFLVPFCVPDILGVRSLSYARLSRTVKRWEFLPLTSWQAHLPQGAGAWRPGAQRQRTAAPDSVCGVTFVFTPVPWSPRSHRGGSGGARWTLGTQRSRIFYNQQHGHPPFAPEGGTGLSLRYKENARNCK